MRGTHGANVVFERPAACLPQSHCCSVASTSRVYEQAGELREFGPIRLGARCAGAKRAGGGVMLELADDRSVPGAGRSRSVSRP